MSASRSGATRDAHGPNRHDQSWQTTRALRTAINAPVQLRVVPRVKRERIRAETWIHSLRGRHLHDELRKRLQVEALQTNDMMLIERHTAGCVVAVQRAQRRRVQEAFDRYSGRKRKRAAVPFQAIEAMTERSSFTSK